ncbi:MAG: nucleoside hydrolase [Chloroflexota bacterium]
MKVYLDTDFGGDMDDLCALTMPLHWPDAEIVGITTVAEERGHRAGYVSYALKLARRGDIPVAAGADGARHTFRSPVAFPDEAAYWPEPITPCPGPEDAALALLCRSVEAGATVIAVGPYTNLALADSAFPGLLAGAPLYTYGRPYPPGPAGLPRLGSSHRLE